MNKKLLITGGPVHAFIDDVKIVTNVFKGGLISLMADSLASLGHDITYVCSKDSVKPDNKNIKIIQHKGIHDYEEKVLSLAPNMDGVILGAAVANLIPKNKIEGKFPSHNYKVGDTIPIQFTIAPRIIDEVKKVAPNTHLFGFKLLSDISHDELIRAAYGVLLESKATAIFANDTKDLSVRYAVMKERSVHKQYHGTIHRFIDNILNDEYYKTEIVYAHPFATGQYAEMSMLAHEIFDHLNDFTTTPEGYIFGTIAQRCNEGFYTTGRGKRECDDLVKVKKVDHEKRIVYSYGKKATLNAPLLDTIFKSNNQIMTVLHFHNTENEYPTLPYAPSGTVRDSIREVKGSFNVENHGCYILKDINGNIL